MMLFFKNFFKQNKRVFYYLGFFTVVYFMTTQMSFADPLEVKVQTDWPELAATINTALIGLSAIVGVFTYFITLFLEPSWLNGTLFGLDVYFKNIWILVSNVVYFIFAFLLIWIAFMNIIGKGQDKYQLKQVLPKFIIGVLIVPFSWFIIQFILSLSAILTVSALTLPSDTFGVYEKEINNIKIPTKCHINVSSLDKGKTGDKGSDGEEPKKDPNVSTEQHENRDNLFWCDQASTQGLSDSMKSSPFGLISTYSYGILKLHNITQIAQGDLIKGKIKNVGDLIVHILFDIVFVAVYMVLIMALGMVLIVRGVYIWIYTMLSPVFGLMYFFDKNEGGGDGFFSKFNIKEFISLAMVPVYVMLALSFGFLFINVTLTGLGKNVKDNTQVTGSSKISIDKSSITIKGKDDDKGFTLDVQGAFGEALEEGVEKAGQGIYDLGNTGLGIIGTLILRIFGVIVFWIAIMTALRTSSITKAVVEPLHAFGGQVGNLMAKSPQYLPVFGGQSMQSMQQVGASASTYYTSTKPGEAARGFMSKHGLFGNVGAGLEADKLIAALDNNSNIDTVAEHIKSTLKEAGSSASASMNEKVINSLLKVAQKYDVDGYKDKKASDIKNKKDEFVNLVKAIDGKFYTQKGKDIILDGSATTGNFTAKDYDKYIDSLKNGDASSGEQGANASIDVKITTGDVLKDNDGNNRVNVKVGGKGVGNLLVDDDGRITESNDVLVKRVRTAITQGLGKQIIDEIDSLNFTDDAKKEFKKSVIKDLYYNKKTQSYGIQKADGYEKVDNYDDIK